MASTTMLANGARAPTWRCVACLHATAVPCCPPAALVPTPSLASSPHERFVGTLVAARRDGEVGGLLRATCAGPPLHQSVDVACRLDRGRAVWLWMGFLDELLPVPPLFNSDPRFARALDQGHDLVVELPDPSLAARVEVRRARGTVQVPSRDEILTRLWILLRGQRTRPRRLALVIEGPPLSTMTRVQAAGLADEVGFYPDRRNAIAWLLDRDVPRPPLTRARLTAEALRIELEDCGGAAGRTLLARLHADTLAAHPAASAHPERPGEVHFRRAHGAAPVHGAMLMRDGVRWSRSLALCGVDPAAQDPVPAWRGWMRPLLRGRVPIEVSVARHGDVAVHVLVPGRRRLTGERHLGRFVASHRGEAPIVIACTDDADPHLVAQARDAFPGAPILPLSPRRPFELIRAIVDRVPIARGRAG